MQGMKAVVKYIWHNIPDANGCPQFTASFLGEREASVVIRFVRMGFPAAAVDRWLLMEEAWDLRREVLD